MSKLSKEDIQRLIEASLHLEGLLRVALARPEAEIDADIEAAFESLQEEFSRAIADMSDQSDQSDPSAYSETLKVDDMLARKESEDLRRAFTLNDKFRFRRSLFGGDNDKFVMMLDRIESADDFGVAERYVLEDVDPESPDYEDFINIVKAHFGVK